MNTRLLVFCSGWILHAIIGLPCRADRLRPSEDSALWRVGVAKVDITPDQPLRLSGYGSRSEPSEAVDTPLAARCLAVSSNVTAEGAKPGGDGATDQPRQAEIHLLVSIDTIGLPASLSGQICQQIEARHQIPRSRVMLCSTHSHCAPDLVSELSNIFQVPLTPEQREASLKYRDQLVAGVLQAVDQSILAMEPGNIDWGQGEIGFAANRRVLQENRWAGFGVQAGAPVDHSVPVLKVTDAAGTVRGIVFNYACHCTTMGPDVNRVNAEWAGYAASALEAAVPESVALCTIGCGADANPEPRGSVELAQLHGRQLAAEVQRVLEQPMRSLAGPLVANFDYAALSFDLPTIEEITARLNDPTPQVRRRAQYLDAVYRRDGRLPATYPVPIASWRFGSDLTMVFLGGEVVVDYALRLRDELSDKNLWVTAYANDVMGYLCSERMRIEGGYEYDQSTVYYNLPGPWAAGTEDLFIDRVKQVVQSRGRAQAVPAEETISMFQISPGYDIELVASEPLVVDPINMAFADDGRLWVVEMGDYPEGSEAHPGGGGRIKVLADEDRDGRFDSATLFADGLDFPTGVFPWGDGVIVAAAPEIFYAADTDWDGTADTKEVWFSGFPLANPQHRINGFTYALDHSLHCASGDNLGVVNCLRTGQQIDAGGHDIQIWPDSGELELVNGRSQFIRSRNGWGEWFGSDNSRPMYHYPIDVRYANRQMGSGFSGNMQQLFDPPVAPPVFPASPTIERFNDLFAANRFTSACSAIVVDGNWSVDQNPAAIVCEPVHNLVHRSILKRDGASYRAEREQQLATSELLASRDPWFRPVRVLLGPDDCLWVVDMYRESIEHPEWIPEAWQQQLDLRAGQDRGRIYRLVPRGTHPPQSLSMDRLEDYQLVQMLDGPVEAKRALAHQRLAESFLSAPADEIVNAVEDLLIDPQYPVARVHAMHLLRRWERLTPNHLLVALNSDHHGCQIAAIPLTEAWLDASPELLDAVVRLSDSDDLRVVMRVALAMGATDDPKAGEALARISRREDLDRWVVAAIGMSLRDHASAIADVLIDSLRTREVEFNAADENLLSRVLVAMRDQGVDLNQVAQRVLAEGTDEATWPMKFASIYASLLRSESATQDLVTPVLKKQYRRAVDVVSNPDHEIDVRCRALRLLGVGLGPAAEEQRILVSLLTPETPLEIQLQSIDRMAVIGDAWFASQMIDSWPRLTTGIRNACVSRMMTRGVWQEQLIGALEKGQIAVNDLTPATRQQLRLTGNRSQQVRVDRLLGAAGQLAKRELVEAYLAEFPGHGDASRGEALFRQHCAVCHLSQGDETPVGASLQNLSNRSPRFLVESILDPNRAVDPKYQAYTVQTFDGRVLVGAIDQESGGQIVLAQVDGRRTSLRREEIEQLQNSGMSLMPEGLENQLSPAQMVDLVRYLERSP
jgi:putative membrane-bound dehydrogenase-like protein